MPILRSASVLTLCLSALLLIRCETDIDVIAPKRDMTIIYGLLEGNKTRHYIRINKSFVGEEAATELAAMQGINEYADSELTAKIIELNTEEIPTGREWTLIPTYISNKEPGVFNNDSNKVYYFDAQLDVSLLYKIECKVNLSGEEEKTVSAVTDVLGNKEASSGDIVPLRLDRPRLSGSSTSTDRANDEVSFVTPSGYSPGYKIQWSGTEGGVRYSTYARLYYWERDVVSGQVIRKDSVTIPLGTKEVSPNETVVDFTVNTEDIFATIGQRVADYTATDDFVREVSDTLQFFLETANEELATYIAINQPVTEVVQERPSYTNVDNGIGIFASRLISSTYHSSPLRSGRIMDNPTMEELLYSNAPGSGNYTVSKNFTNDRCVVSTTGPNCD